ncbi:MAG: OmpA family protein [Rhodobacteraceae bacterium]|nr:OmpA family protein [Paracoccaceae bacterium]
MNKCAKIYLSLAFVILLFAPLNAQSPINNGSWENVFETNTPEGFLEFPTGPYSGDQKNLEIVNGQIRTVVYQIQGENSTFKLLSQAWNQLRQLGYSKLFQCNTRLCGGFQFRNQIEVVEPPFMFVNLGNYKFLSANRNHLEGQDHATILVSRSQATGFVQFIFITQPKNEGGEDTPTVELEGPDLNQSSLETALLEQGFVILRNIDFTSGMTSLENENLEIFFKLAEFLNEHPQYSIVLVGHTDTSGSQEINSQLSFARAESVLNHLTENYGVNPNQLLAHGNSYFSPRTTNLTPEGQRQNRRVEAVLVPNTESE